jgi:hypothetical protein
MSCPSIPAEETELDAALPKAARLAIERWFVQRGVPQLVEGYGSEARLDARAAPYIAAWLVLGAVLYWGVNPAWTRLENLFGVIATLAFVVTGFLAVRLVRGRPSILQRRTFDFVEIVLLGLLPAVPAGIIDGSLRESVIAFLNAMLGIGVIYVVILFGLVELAIWALGRVRSQFAGIIGLLATTLPVLLILVAFLLFASEIWEAANALRGVELVAVLGLLVLIGALLVVTTFSARLASMEETLDWDAVLQHAQGTPARLVAPRVDPPSTKPRRLTWLERVNLHALVLIDQLLQSAFVALLVMAFLVVFGLIAIPAEVQDRWIGEPVTTLLQFGLFGEERRLSGELITVSALLSGIVGLYFTGLAITDSSQRAAEFRRAVADVRHLLAGRAVYLAALRQDEVA